VLPLVHLNEVVLDPAEVLLGHGLIVDVDAVPSNHRTVRERRKALGTVVAYLSTMWGDVKRPFLISLRVRRLLV